MVEKALAILSDLAEQHVQTSYREAVATIRAALAVSPTTAPNSDYATALHLIGSIFFYGSFRAETANERDLERLLRILGYFYETEAEVDRGRQRLNARPGHSA